MPPLPISEFPTAAVRGPPDHTAPAQGIRPNPPAITRGCRTQAPDLEWLGETSSVLSPKSNSLSGRISSEGLLWRLPMPEIRFILPQRIDRIKYRRNLEIAKTSYIVAHTSGCSSKPLFLGRTVMKAAAMGGPRDIPLVHCLCRLL